MPIIKTKTGRKLLKNAKSLFVLPYRYDTTLSQHVLGQNLYDLSAIIGDSITLEQSDGDTQTKENEFTNEALVKNVTTGEWKFTAQCLDLQNSVLKALFMAYTNDTYGAAALRPEYETLYALIMVRFSDTDTPDVWLPKVLLNSKLMLQQMKTRGSQGNISGTLFSSRCGIIQSSFQAQGHIISQLMPLADNIAGTNVYTPNVPVLFAPQTHRVIVFNHRAEADGETVFDNPNPATTGNQDCCSHGYVVSDDNPAVAVI